MLASAAVAAQPAPEQLPEAPGALGSPGDESPEPAPGPPAPPPPLPDDPPVRPPGLTAPAAVPKAVIEPTLSPPGLTPTVDDCRIHPGGAGCPPPAHGTPCVDGSNCVLRGGFGHYFRASRMSHS